MVRFRLYGLYFRVMVRVEFRVAVLRRSKRRLGLI